MLLLAVLQFSANLFGVFPVTWYAWLLCFVQSAEEMLLLKTIMMCQTAAQMCLFHGSIIKLVLQDFLHDTLCTDKQFYTQGQPLMLCLVAEQLAAADLWTHHHRDWQEGHCPLRQVEFTPGHGEV